MRQYKKNQKIEVDWIDTVQNSAWMSETKAAERPDDADCQTIGYYYKHDREFLYLSHTISHKERDKTTIPLGCIKRTRIVKC